MSRQVPWCRSPEAHQNATRRGRSPTHPRGDRPIDSKLAAFMTQQYFENTGDDQMVLTKGDCLCRTCYERAMKQFTSNSSNLYSSSSSSSSESTDEEMAELDMHFEKNKSKEILNDIFRILGVSSITDL